MPGCEGHVDTWHTRYHGKASTIRRLAASLPHNVVDDAESCHTRKKRFIWTSLGGERSLQSNLETTRACLCSSLHVEGIRAALPAFKSMNDRSCACWQRITTCTLQCHGPLAFDQPLCLVKRRKSTGGCGTNKKVLHQECLVGGSMQG